MMENCRVFFFLNCAELYNSGQAGVRPPGCHVNSTLRYKDSDLDVKLRRLCTINVDL